MTLPAESPVLCAISRGNLHAANSILQAAGPARRPRTADTLMQVSTPDFVDYAAISPQLWKNGRGITRNLFDDSDRDGAWTWRISIAEITGSQPYSAYPGVRRGQVALGPGDVQLTINGEPTLLPVEGIIVFDGEDEVSATPHEAGFLDLNVMTRRDTWAATVELAGGVEAVEAGEGELVVLVALEDDCTIDDRPRRRLDAAKLGESSSVVVGGRFVLARLRRRSGSGRGEEQFIV